MSQVAAGAEWTGPNQEPGNSRLIVEFFYEACQNQAKSDEAGRPIFEDQEFIRIMIPGDKDNIIVRPIRAKDKQEFSQQYAAFKNSQEQKIEGTPLDKLPFMTKAQVLEFKTMNIHTAEQVRDMADVNAQKFMGINALKKKITDFLDAAAGNAVSSKLRAELEKRDTDITVLKQLLDEQGKKIDELSRRK